MLSLSDTVTFDLEPVAPTFSRSILLLFPVSIASVKFIACWYRDLNNEVYLLKWVNMGLIGSGACSFVGLHSQP